MEQNAEHYCISMLTVHLVLHLGLKDGLKISGIKTFLSDYPKVALLPEDYVAALELMRNVDHEDALQLASAIRIGCSSLVTLDQKFGRAYEDKLQFITL
jgi:predicted nucleic acid-binding protein